MNAIVDRVRTTEQRDTGVYPAAWAGLEVDDFMKRLPTMAPTIILETQNRVLELISRNASLAESLGAIARFAEECIPGMRASVLYYDPQRGCLTRGGYGSMPLSFVECVDGMVPGPGMGSCGTCAYTHERIISKDVQTDPLWTPFLGLCATYDIRSAWSTPLHSGHDGSLLGVFGMYHAEVREPSAAELEIVDHFTHLASIAAERHRFDTEQNYRASHDAVTGLGNRRLLDLKGPALLERCKREGGPLSLAFIDLDRFKAVNDAFGHLAGDELLRAVAAGLQMRLAPYELLVRFGGDEFLVFLPTTVADAKSRLEQLRVSFAEDLTIADARVRISFSGGLVECDAQHVDIDALIFAADEAVRRAKALGGDRDVVADHEQSAQTQQQRVRALQLADALDEGHLDPHLQPIMDLEDGRVRGFELLFRLKDPRFASIPIPQIIAIAEETGLINRVGILMLRHACRLLRDRPLALSDVWLNVNVSVRQLLRSEFIGECAAALAEFQVDPAQICLELTESHWLDSGGPAHDALLCLKALGFKLALDDFGTGYASLTYLQSLPVDTIKVDKSFVHQAALSERGLNLCAALLSMGQACQMGIVAEGVETRAQAELLAGMGYPLAQGFLWSRPMPSAAAMTWLDEARAAH